MSCAEYSPRLVADVGRVAFEIGVPAHESLSDSVEGLLRRQIMPIGNSFGDRHRHGGVVAPFAGVVVAETAALHDWNFFRAESGLELVGNTERVADGGAEKDRGGAVSLRGTELHWWVGLSGYGWLVSTRRLGWRLAVGSTTGEGWFRHDGSAGASRSAQPPANSLDQRDPYRRPRFRLPRWNESRVIFET